MAKISKFSNYFKGLFIAFFVVLSLGSFSQVAQADFCADISSEFGGFLECDEKFTSFSAFRGGIQTPDGSGLDPSLTQTDSAQDFVLNLANFALSFLGMIAILVIIYSGFLYVTSAFDDSQAESAKNNIKYSIYGIIVILASYAIVNTVIQAPGGGVDSQTAGESNMEQLERFNSVAFELKDIARDLTKAYEIYVEDTSNLESIIRTKPGKFTSRKQVIAQLQQMRSGFVNLERERGLLSNTGFAAREIVNEGIDPTINFLNGIINAEKQDVLERRYQDSGFENLFENIGAGFAALGRDLFGDSEMRNYICSLEPEDRPLTKQVEGCENAFQPKLIESNGLDALNLNCSAAQSSIACEHQTDFNEIEGGPQLFQQIYYRVAILVAHANETSVREDFGQQLLDIQERLLVLKDIAHSYPTLAGDLGTILDEGEVFNGCNEEDGCQSAIDSSLLDSNQPIISLMRDFEKLYKTIETAQFTVPIITTNVTEGSAPLVVTFDASGSYDPSNRSVLADMDDGDDGEGNFAEDNQNRLLWDIDGDGRFEAVDGAAGPNTEEISSLNKNIECQNYDKETISVTCVFKTPGSFRVGLLLRSLSQTIIADTQDSNTSTDQILKNILPGIAYQTIRVKPPTSQINLLSTKDLTFDSSVDNISEILERFFLGLSEFVSINQNSQANIDGHGATLLRWYDNRGGLAFDTNEVRYTLSEARQGIHFNATQSMPKDNLKRFTWRFSDRTGTFSGSGQQLQDTNVTGGETGAPVIESELGPKLNRAFTKRGRFQGQLEVEDNNGNLDRKLFDVLIGDTVARLSANKTSGLIGDEFIISAQNSRSDFGSLTHTWKNDGDDIDVGAPDDEFNFNADADIMRFTPTSHGTYLITMSATPGVAAQEDEASITIVVKPRPLEPIIVVTQNNLTDPAIYTLDASLTKDPDEDIIGFQPAPPLATRYEWKILNAVEGTHYEAFGSGPTEDTTAIITFKKPGSYKIALKASKGTDDNGNFSPIISSTTETSVLVTSVMNLVLSNPGTAALEENVNTSLLETGEQEITVKSRTANRVTMEFGDGAKQTLNRTQDGVDGNDFKFKHKYTRSGAYKLSIFAESETESKVLSSTFVVSNAGDVTSMISAQVQGNIFLSGANDIPDVFRKTRIEFDASRSLNQFGDNSGLKYSWDLGDGTTRTRKKFTYNYRDYPPLGEPGFDVTLTVSDAKDPSKTSTTSVFIPLSKAKPSLEGITAEAVNGPITPFDVRVKAIGPFDADGRIETFRYYYFPLDDPDTQLGVKVSNSANAVLRIGTLGDEGEEVDYGICIDVIDNEGIERKCEVMFLEGTPAVITAINGANKLPTSKFRADNTSIKIGESVTFFDESFDPDGTIVERRYDIQGDGSFANDEVFVSRASVINYDTISPRKGFRVVQEVVDDKGGVAISRPIFVYVESNFDAPEAAFTVEVDGMKINLQNNSKPDTDADIVKQIWDFDIKTDSDGNDNPEDDEDSLEIEPSFTYKRAGTKDIKLTVIDSEGNIDTATEKIQVGGKLAKPLPAFKFTRDKLSVQMKNNSEADFINDGTIVSYKWDFDLATDSKGGNNPANNVDSTAKNPVVTYDTPGTYQVSLTVEDNEGNVDTVINTVVVQLEATENPTAAFTFSIDDKTVEFENNSSLAEGSNLSVKEFFWDFDLKDDADGDGDPKNDKQEINKQSPSYTYDNYGVNAAALTIIDSALNSDRVERFIEIPFPQAATPTDQAISNLANSGQAPGGAGSVPGGQQVFVNPQRLVADQPAGFSATSDRILEKTPEQLEIERQLGIGQDPNQSQTPNLDGEQANSSSAIASQFNPKKFIITEPMYNEVTDVLSVVDSSVVLTFRFDHLPDFITKVEVDSNVYRDSNDDGIFNNDINFETTTKQSFTNTYNASTGLIRALVTLYDNTGKKYYDAIDVNFRGVDFQASLNLNGDSGVETAGWAVVLTGASAVFVRLLKLF